MKNKASRKSPPVTWWVGWVVTFPFRLGVLAPLFVAVACAPSMFYPFLNGVEVEEDCSKWRLK